MICVVDDVPAGGDWSCTPQVPLHEGLNTLTATSVGPSGLSSSPSSPISTTVSTRWRRSRRCSARPPCRPRTRCQRLPARPSRAAPSTSMTAAIRLRRSRLALPAAMELFPAPRPLRSLARRPTHFGHRDRDGCGRERQLAVQCRSVCRRYDAARGAGAEPDPGPGRCDAGQHRQHAADLLGNRRAGRHGYRAINLALVTRPSSAPPIVKADGTWSCQDTTPADRRSLDAVHLHRDADQSGRRDQRSEHAAADHRVDGRSRDADADRSRDSFCLAKCPGLRHRHRGRYRRSARSDRSGSFCTATVQPDGTWSCTTAALPEGTTTVTAVDVSGTSGVPSQPSNSGQITVITYGPIAPQLAQTVSPTNNATPTFTGKAQPDSTVTVSAGGQVLCTTTAGVDGSFSCLSTIAHRPMARTPRRRRRPMRRAMSAPCVEPGHFRGRHLDSSGAGDRAEPGGERRPARRHFESVSGDLGNWCCRRHGHGDFRLANALHRAGQPGWKLVLHQHRLAPGKSGDDLSAQRDPDLARREHLAAGDADHPRRHHRDRGAHARSGRSRRPAIASRRSLGPACRATPSSSSRE